MLFFLHFQVLPKKRGRQLQEIPANFASGRGDIVQPMRVLIFTIYWKLSGHFSFSMGSSVIYHCKLQTAGLSDPFDYLVLL